MSLYDVLLVNSVADGLNLVSKEGPVVNRRNGSLVLSRAVGSFRELEFGAFGIDPLDVGETAVALGDALDLAEGIVESAPRCYGWRLRAISSRTGCEHSSRTRSW